MDILQSALFLSQLDPFARAVLGGVDVLPVMAPSDYERASSLQPLEPGELRTPQGALPLQSMHVNAHISGLIVELKVQQTFVNRHAQPLEATYIFPLPHHAGVTKFLFTVAGRTVEGVLQERGEARRTYDSAIAAGKRAAIAEEERPDVFTMRVGNLMPGEEATVELILSGPLHCEDGEVTFRFPLVVAQRYTPGTPLPGDPSGDGITPDTDAAPDASRISPPVLLPGHPNPVRLGVEICVDAPKKHLKNLRCSVAGLKVAGDGERTWFRLHPGARLDRDLIVRFSLAESQITSALQVFPDPSGGREGTFMVTLVPPEADPDARTPRDVIFVLDRSGSMQGWKMVAARRATMRMIDTLLVQDRFTVIAFDSVAETPPGFSASRLNDASPAQRYAACEYLRGVEARGGTEMAAPLQSAADSLASGFLERDKVLVLVTDGQVSNESQILKMLDRKLRGTRVFTVGIDQAVNASFLERLATLGDGACELVDSEARLEDVMDRLHAKISNPVLTKLSIEVEGMLADSVVPKRLPALFDGVPLSVFGRYRGAPPRSGSVRGQVGASRDQMHMKLNADTVSNPAMRTVWARAQVRALEDRFHTGERALQGKIIEHSLVYGVLCSFTAFVAVDREVVNARGPLHRVVQAVEDPHASADQAESLSKREVHASSKASAPEDIKRKRSVTSVGMANMAPKSSISFGGPPPRFGAAPSSARTEALSMSDADDLLAGGAAMPEEQAAFSNPYLKDSPFTQATRSGMVRPSGGFGGPSPAPSSPDYADMKPFSSDTHRTGTDIGSFHASPSSGSGALWVAVFVLLMLVLLGAGFVWWFLF